MKALRNVPNCWRTASMASRLGNSGGGSSGWFGFVVKVGCCAKHAHSLLDGVSQRVRPGCHVLPDVATAYRSAGLLAEVPARLLILEQGQHLLGPLVRGIGP